MTRAEYLALAERAERAEATAREQAEILLAAIDAGGLEPLADLQARRFVKAGAFLDAALSLVPEGGEWRREWNPALRKIVVIVDKPGAYGGMSENKQPALALVAAALRARAEEAKDG